MTKRKTLPKIGSVMYAVHNKHVNQKINGSKILIVKVKTFERVDDEVRPVLNIVGTKTELNYKLYSIFSKIEEAVKTIR